MDPDDAAAPLLLMPFVTNLVHARHCVTDP